MRHFKLLLLDIYRIIVHPEEIIFMVIFDFLLLVAAYILSYIYPQYSGEWIASFILILLFINSLLGQPLFIRRDQKNGWLLQLACAGIRAEYYYLFKLISGFCQQIVPVLIYLLVLLFLFELTFVWLFATAVITVLIMIGVIVVNVITLSITPPRDYILFLVLAIPMLIPLFLAGYVLLGGAYLSFKTYPWAWMHWLISYDLIMLAAVWFGTEFLWEEFS